MIYLTNELRLDGSLSKEDEKALAQAEQLWKIPIVCAHICLKFDIPAMCPTEICFPLKML